MGSFSTRVGKRKRASLVVALVFTHGSKLKPGSAGSSEQVAGFAASRAATSFCVSVMIEPLEVFDCTRPSVIANRQTGYEVDVVMSGVSITERRKQTVAFTSPYLAIGQMAVVRSEDLARLGGAGALDQKGVRVGVQRLTTGARYARDELNRATLVEFGSVESGIEALREKRIDAFIHDAPTVWRLTGRFEDDSSRALAGLYRPLTDEKIAWAVRKADAGTIGAALDAGLAKLRADGTLEQIIDRWITVRKVAKGPAELAPAK